MRPETVETWASPALEHVQPPLAVRRLQRPEHCPTSMLPETLRTSSSSARSTATLPVTVVMRSAPPWPWTVTLPDIVPMTASVPRGQRTSKSAEPLRDEAILIRPVGSDSMRSGWRTPSSTSTSGRSSATSVTRPERVSK
jgi:hypothetical protein